MTAPVSGQEVSAFAHLNLADYGQQDLLEARQGLMSDLVTLTPDDESAAVLEDRARALLDLAELHLSQMLRTEAADYLAGVDPEALSAEAQQRHRTLELALALMQPQDGLRQAVLRSTGWTEGQALRAAAFARLGAEDEAATLMPMIVEGLATLSPAMTAAILPDLLEAALNAQDWTVAETLAARFADHAELRDAASFRFLLARASEMSGDLVMAFDGYASAAGGRDAYAHRARLALVALGRRTETLPLSDAVTLLKTARWAWSGDEFATQGIAMLADLALEQGDTEAALWALAQLVVLAATPDEVEATRQRARQVIAGFYNAGAAGQITIEDFVAGHAMIMTHWRNDPVFVENAVALPQTLLNLGMTAFAAREFRTLRAVVEAGDGPDDSDFVDHLLKQEARALLAGGQAGAAAELLRRIGQRGDAETDALLVRALRRSGGSEGLADVDATALNRGAQRSRAVALYEAQDWMPARQALLDLWGFDPVQFAFPDAARLALAAHMAGDGAALSRAATALSSLSERPEWADVAAGLKPQGGTLQELSKDTIKLSMARADRALGAVTAVMETKNNQGYE